PRDDNMLKICSDGRKAALDLELVGISPAALSKADAVVENVARIYYATRHLVLPGDQPGAARHGGLPVAFRDLGTAGPAAGPPVEIFRYVTERSFDSFLWQALERKSRFIGQVLSGRSTGRDVDDLGDATLSYAEVKALATGNPLLLELAEANSQVTRLRQLAA